MASYSDFVTDATRNITSNGLPAGGVTGTFPIAIKRDASGNLPTNADLKQFHGRTLTIDLDGTTLNIDHYSTTYVFRYFMGCFTGRPVS